MKRWGIGVALLVALTAVSAACGQTRGVPLFANPSNGPNQPTPNGWYFIGTTGHGTNTSTDPGMNLFVSHPAGSVGTGIPSAAGGTGGLTTALPSSLFRGTVFLPTTFVFR
jgi:hypothetical protein